MSGQRALAHGKRKRLKKQLPKPAHAKKAAEKQRIAALEQAATDFIASDGLKVFNDLPISDLTKRGLKKAFFVEMTDIQAKSIPVSLKGQDVLGAARTGSGKTLAFLIPMLEILYRRKWGPQDGLGALIISPTRELAVQIFQVLRTIGVYHTFSAGLVIGGKSLEEERDRLSRMNILVATPGRLLQHMDQTVGFACDNLQMLILDEADRILDMGFYRTLSAVILHLPNSRQTLLFSATQTQSVKDLARLSLQDPIYVGVKETGYDGATPKNLEQHYAVCELDKKLDVLWGFIKTHLKCKMLVFMSSCKQVRFVYETFCKMHPGIPLLHLHGKQKQSARLAVYTRFTSTSHAVLFATDIAARGLDFPSVDWVVQIDAPEDAETYIHRVGRTARYESAGKGLLLLLPSEEEGMAAALKAKGITIAAIKIKPSKAPSIENQLQNLAFQDPEIKYLGQRAFVSYLRSVYLHKDKSIFKLEELPVQKFAASLGLPGAPKIKFLSKEIAKRKKNAPQSAITGRRGKEESSSDGDDLSAAEQESEHAEDKVSSSQDEALTAPPSSKPKVRTKYDRMFNRKNQGILSESYRKLVEQSASEDEEEDFITLKRADHDLSTTTASVMQEENLSKRKQKLGRAKRAVVKHGAQGKKLVFDDEDRAHELYELADAERVYADDGGLEGVMLAGHKFAEGEKKKMAQADVVDKREAKEKKKERKRKRKGREREGALDGEVMTGPILAPPDEDDGYVSPEFDLWSASASGEDESLHRGDKKLRLEKGFSIEDEEQLALRLLRRKQ